MGREAEAWGWLRTCLGEGVGHQHKDPSIPLRNPKHHGALKSKGSWKWAKDALRGCRM